MQLIHHVSHHYHHDYCCVSYYQGLIELQQVLRLLWTHTSFFWLKTCCLAGQSQSGAMWALGGRDWRSFAVNVASLVIFQTKYIYSFLQPLNCLERAKKASFLGKWANCNLHHVWSLQSVIWQNEWHIGCNVISDDSLPCRNLHCDYIVNQPESFSPN